MRKLIELKIVNDDGNKLDRNKIINYMERIKAMRYPTAAYINMAKKQNMRTGNMVETVQIYRRSLKDALNPKRYFEVIRHFGRNEKVSEYLPIQHKTVELRQVVSDLKSKIRNIRERRKNDVRDWLGEKKPNTILFQLYERSLSDSKKPTTDDKYIGIEIECVMPEGSDLSLLFPFSKWVNMGTDGSIRYERGEMGRELRVLVKKDELKTVIPPLMAALAKMGAKVNKSCGLHVHLDQRNALNPGESFEKLVRSLGLLYMVVPKSRRENTYCKRNRKVDFGDQQYAERYKAINAAAYRRYKTLEVRLFGGTLNANKIINWIEVLHAIADGKMFKRCPKNFDTAAKYWNLTTENLAWLKARQEQFAAINPLSPTSESDTETIVDDVVTEEDELERELTEVAA